jgi:regulator of sigma E protease
MTILYFIIALGLLVFIHEFGHFLAAKKQGIGVEVFSIGFGPKLISFKRGETTYTISLLPFGGYVKLVGEDPAEAMEASGPQDKKYSLRPLWQKIIVVFAGPAMNLLLAFLLLPVVFMLGRMEPIFLDQKPVVIGLKKGSVAQKADLRKGDEILEIGGQTIERWKDFLNFVLIHGEDEVTLKFRRGDEILTKTVVIDKSPDTHAGTLGVEPSYFIGNDPVIDEVQPDGPAGRAGLRAGDRVLKMGETPIESWIEMTEEVGKSEGKPISMQVKRGAEEATLSVTPRYDEGLKKWLIGVKKSEMAQSEAFTRKKYGFGEAISKGVEENIKLSKLTLSVLGRLVTFQLSYKTLGGPIRIAQASAMAAESGFADFLYFLSFLSLQLGLLNLLPLPALDGGHLLFFAIEGVIRRPLSVKVRGMIEQAGFFLLISLMILVTMNDVDSVWGFHSLFEKVKNLVH